MKRLALIVIALSVLSGCQEKEQASAVEPLKSVQTASAGRITVIAPPETQAAAKPENSFRSYDIRGQSVIKYAPDGAEITEAVKNVQVVVAVRNNPYGSIQWKLMGKRLSKEFILYCSACHDDYGNGVIGPSLLTKNEKEVRNSIDLYLEKPDANVLMTDLVHNMTDDQINFVSKDLARFNAEIHKEKAEVAAKDNKL